MLLKAYIDNILVAGKTFQYTENGLEGLLKGKRAALCLASSGVYEGPMAAYDHFGSYLRTALSFMGFSDVAEIRAAGQGLGPEAARASKEMALQKARELAVSF